MQRTTQATPKHASSLHEGLRIPYQLALTPAVVCEASCVYGLSIHLRAVVNTVPRVLSARCSSCQLRCPPCFKSTAARQSGWFHLLSRVILHTCVKANWSSLLRRYFNPLYSLFSTLLCNLAVRTGLQAPAATHSTVTLVKRLVSSPFPPSTSPSLTFALHAAWSSS